MPPLLSSLAAALLSPRRTAAPTDHIDLFSFDITSLHQQHQHSQHSQHSQHQRQHPRAASPPSPTASVTSSSSVSASASASSASTASPAPPPMLARAANDAAAVDAPIDAPPARSSRARLRLRRRRPHRPHPLAPAAPPAPVPAPAAATPTALMPQSQHRRPDPSTTTPSPTHASLPAAPTSPTPHLPTSSATAAAPATATVTTPTTTTILTSTREPPAPAPRHQPQPQPQPHPAAAMAVTYSLFLLGRGHNHPRHPAADPPDNPRPRRRLPVRLDLHARGAVAASRRRPGPRARRHRRTCASMDDLNVTGLPASPGHGHGADDERHTSSLKTLPPSSMYSSHHDSSLDHPPSHLNSPTHNYDHDHDSSSSSSGGSSRNSEIEYDQQQQRQQYSRHLARASNLRDCPRHIAIVTTAAIPWMTGTSVNPALRAIYLAKDGHHVTLVIPWLSSAADQRALFSKGSPVFRTRAEHAAYIRQWAHAQVPDVAFDVRFYDGVYAEHFGSILPVGAITDVFAGDGVVNNDVCILEEPEHLTWHHAGRMWTEIFNFVVGIIHTNYIEYARHYGVFGPQKALAMLFLNKWVCRGYCHRIVKLSDAVQTFPNSITRNVHGVRDKFIRIGRARPSDMPFPRGAYFLGKVLWAKGYRDLIDNMTHDFRLTGTPLPIDMFGDGPNTPDVQHEVDTNPALANVNFHAKVADPTSDYIQGYKLFVNASCSDVVCTATAEALAMGKLVVCLEHPSNEFFATFPNCITYRTPDEFSECVRRAMQMEPRPMSEEDAYRLTWEAATERLYDATRLPLSRSRPSKVDLALGSAHATLSKIYPQPGKGIQRARSKEQKQHANE